MGSHTYRANYSTSVPADSPVRRARSHEGRGLPYTGEIEAPRVDIGEI